MPTKLFLILLAAALWACSPEKKALSVAEQIKAQNEKLHQAVLTKNLSLLDEVYAPDAYFLSPGNSPIMGIENIKKRWEAGLGSMKEMSSSSLSLIGEGDLVSEVGLVKTHIETADTSFVIQSKYNNVWQKDAEGNYRLKVDIWNAYSE